MAAGSGIPGGAAAGPPGRERPPGLAPDPAGSGARATTIDAPREPGPASSIRAAVHRVRADHLRWTAGAAGRLRLGGLQDRLSAGSSADTHLAAGRPR